MRTIKITLANGNTIITDINGTDEEILAYYRNQYLNIGQPHDPTADNMQRVVSVEFLQ